MNFFSLMLFILVIKTVYSYHIGNQFAYHVKCCPNIFFGTCFWVDLGEFHAKITRKTTMSCTIARDAYPRNHSRNDYFILEGVCHSFHYARFQKSGLKERGKTPCQISYTDAEYMRDDCQNSKKHVMMCSYKDLVIFEKNLKDLNNKETDLNSDQMKKLANNLNDIIDESDSNEGNEKYKYVDFLYNLAEKRRTADEDYERYIEQGKNIDEASFKHEMESIVICVEKLTQKLLLNKNNFNKTYPINLLKTLNIYATTKLYQPNFTLQFGNMTFERQMLGKNLKKASFPNWSKFKRKGGSQISILPSLLQKRKDSANYYISSSYSEDLATMLDNNKNDSYINSGLISLDIAMDKEDIKEMNGEYFIECTIEHLHPMKEDEQSGCVFWKFDNYSGGYWSSEGCTVTSRTENKTVCKCNHLTNIAVLMYPYKEFLEMDFFIVKILYSLGCGISIIALLLTFIYYAVYWKKIKSKRSVLVLNLSFTLLILNILTLSLQSASKKNSDGCKALAVFLHFFFLSAFFAMLAISVHLMISVFFVFFVFTKKRTTILLISSWTSALLIVSISIVVTRLEGYGTDSICWLSDEKGLFWANTGPIIVIIGCNILVLLAVLMRISKTNASKNDKKKNRIKSSARNILILNPLLGLTWIFGVLIAQKELLVFTYLHAIMNSTQGLFIFILYALCYRPDAKKERKTKLIGNARNKKINDASSSTNTTSKNDESQTFFTNASETRF